MIDLKTLTEIKDRCKEIPYEQVKDTGLPKWPQCIIFGKSVDMSYADEIIRRIDGFFTLGYDGNDQDFISKARKIAKYPNSDDYYRYDMEHDAFIEGRDKYHEAATEWKNKWQTIPLSYLHTSWISSSWIGGPNGWIHPDGNIAYANNIGKWPEVSEVYEELTAIAEAFKDLKFFVTLVDGEEDEYDIERRSVVSFRVWDGEVTAVEPIPLDVALEYAKSDGAMTCMERFDKNMALVPLWREGVYSLGDIQYWSDQVFKLKRKTNKTSD